MNLQTFETHLRQLIGDPTPLRPFVCEGSPLECEIFLVGIEPATELKKEFWDFWKPGHGFDREAWLTTYLQERHAAGKRPVSPTRRNMDQFLAGAEGAKVLETNVFAGPRPRYRKDGSEIRAPFRFLLQAIQPKVIFVHGGPAKKEIAALNLTIPTIEANHLRYQTTKEMAREYGQQAAARLQTKPFA